MTRPCLGLAVLSGLALTLGAAAEAWADCPYRTMTQQGQVASYVAPENSIVCVVQSTPDCPQCRSGVQHQCTAGTWQPIEGSSCGSGPEIAAPPTLPDEANLAGEAQGAQQVRDQQCIYYDRDGRRMELAAEDLAWAEDAGLVVEKKCY